MAIPKSWIDYGAPQRVIVAKKHKPLPNRYAPPATAKVTLNPAGKTFLKNRTGHPGFKANLTPAAARAAITRVKETRAGKAVYPTGTKAKSGNKPTAAATAQDTLAQITQRYIASLQTPAQQAAQTQAWINAALKASAASTNAAYDVEKRDLRQQEQRAHQYAMALGSLRDMSGLQIGADYTNAARNIQGLGTGLTGTIAEAQQAEANQAAQQIAAATQGLGQAKGLDVEGMKNIAQYTGVTKPSETLFGQAASHAAQARLDQDVRGQMIENLASGYRDKAGDVASERAAKLAELAATRPSLYQEAIQNAQTGGRSDMATIISALALQNTASKTPSEIAENQAGTAATISKVTGFVYDPKTGKQQFNKDGTPKLASTHWLPPGSTTPQKIPSTQHVSADGTKLVPNKTATSDATIAKNKADRLAKQGFAPDGKTLLNSDWYWGPDGKPAKVPQGQMRDPKDPTNHNVVDNPSVGATGTGATSTAAKNKQTQRLINTWSTKFDKEMDMENSPYAKDISDPVDRKYEGSQWVPKMSYAAAVTSMKKRLPKSLKNNPQMLANINTSLARIGYKIPGRTTAKKTTGKKGAKTTVKTTPDFSAAGPR